jgi:hypothetical protein
MHEYKQNCSCFGAESKNGVIAHNLLLHTIEESECSDDPKKMTLTYPECMRIVFQKGRAGGEAEPVIFH